MNNSDFLISVIFNNTEFEDADPEILQALNDFESVLGEESTCETKNLRIYFGDANR